jgi:phage repressor protein C with HTH and peptisase S24 domain
MTVYTELQLKLKDLRNSLELNQTDFAEKLGISQSAIANMESGKRDVSKPVLLKIKEIFNINLLEHSEESKLTHYPTNIVPIPFYSAKAAAGSGETLPEYPEKDVLYFDNRWLKNVLGVNPTNLSIIQAQGDSMDGGISPIKDGDLLMVDSSIKSGNNNVFVFNSIDGLRVKRLCWDFEGNVDIISNNPKYEVEHLTADNFNSSYGEIIGKVVWNGSKESV